MDTGKRIFHMMEKGKGTVTALLMFCMFFCDFSAASVCIVCFLLCMELYSNYTYITVYQFEPACIVSMVVSGSPKRW